MTECPGCGAGFIPAGLPPADRALASGECLAAYLGFTARTLTLGDAEFVHQHAVDAWTAQHVGVATSKVGTFFALAGLYLALERGYSGRMVQQAHMAMARGHKRWPEFRPPDRKAATAVTLPLASEDLVACLGTWMLDVWTTWAIEQDRVRRLTEDRLAVDTRRNRTRG